MAKEVLITVGSTKFEGLIRSTDSVEFVRLVESEGYTRQVYQIGRYVVVVNPEVSTSPNMGRTLP
jgi:UDP-N-acetylglucosamine transferase subunit ALG13